MRPLLLYSLLASGLSVDDDSSLLRLFPFPYKLQSHCCRAWLGLLFVFLIVASFFKQRWACKYTR